jgi:phytoene dehydrogenase-like protein
LVLFFKKELLTFLNEMKKPTYDAVFIGAGHNALVCAFYLARRGLKVALAERRNVAGGAAVTEVFHPGFRNSVAAYTVSLLAPAVIREMDLGRHGLRVVLRRMGNFLPADDGRALCTGVDAASDRASIAAFAPEDVVAHERYSAMLERVVAPLRRVLHMTPPQPKGGFHDMLGGVSLGRLMSGLDAETQRDLLDLFTKSAGQMLDARFRGDAIKALLGFDSIVGNYASPYAAGSAYVLLHHVFGEVEGRVGAWGHAIGGMGAITQAMARAAAEAGAEIMLGDGVAGVMVERGAATGVVTQSGRILQAKRVISGVHPQLLYQRLLPPDSLPKEFRARIAVYRSGSATFRMNVALAELPRFTARPDPGPHHTAGIIIGPTLAYMDRAWRDATECGWSRRPIVEMLIPSTLDDSLAPAGQHVASLFCQHFAPDLPNGRTWHDARDEVADLIIDTVTQYAPNFRASVLGRASLSPLDLEEKLGLVHGDIFHGALSLDQLFSARPVLGHGNYRGPLKGLYMCGSGTHPGGGVTGIPGRNAAREILRDVKSWF